MSQSAAVFEFISTVLQQCGRRIVKINAVPATAPKPSPTPYLWQR